MTKQKPQITKERNMNFLIPERSLLQHIAILGKAGSGKTYTAKVIAEHILSTGGRVCAIDPTGVWWGLRTTANGKKSGFPVVIFGGKHADVPLEAEHGKAIAEIVGTTDTSAILDTRAMSVSKRTQFFADFAETLLQKNQGPLHLIIDEAHVFAPQGRVNDPQSGKMLHAANNLVSLGRSSGLRIIMISQRPAKLHKDSLTQAETLIAMRLIAPQDRKAVEDWIGEWADPKEGKSIMKSLPGLPTGQGYVWSPEQNFLKLLKFPRIKTYDSSSAPDGRSESVELANIDLQAITKRLETVAKTATESDPKQLRLRIAQLEKEIKNAAKSAKAVIDPSEIAKAQEIGFTQGIAAGWAQAIERLQAGSPTAIDGGARLKPATPPAKVAQKKHQAVKTAAVTQGHLKPAERKFLAVLAQMQGGIPRNKIALFSGYSVKSRHVDNTLAALRSNGWAEGSNESVRIIDPGLEVLGPFDPIMTGERLRSYWLSQLDKAGGIFMEALFDVYPQRLSRNEIAEVTGYSPSSRHVDNTLAKIRSLELATGGNDGVKASDYFFETT